MEELRYTLITDGSSDDTLLEIIKWLINDLYPTYSFFGQYCDFRPIPNPPESKEVLRRISLAYKLYPFDFCFYHRDAENIDAKNILKFREKEVKEVLPESLKSKVVCVIPVKMMETWLLTDREAIKAAAGNRHYNGDLKLPSIKRLERIQGPKDLLHKLLRQASGNTGRRLKSFNVHQAVHLVAENTEDFSSLRGLEAFRKFESDLKSCIDTILKKSEFDTNLYTN